MTLPIDYCPRRIISLIPSVTATLFDLGFDDSIVGITDYCAYPKDKIHKTTKVGGPKNPNLPLILELDPDLVILNIEENDKETADFLKQQSIPTWVTFPKTVRESVVDLWVLVEMMRSEVAREKVKLIESMLEWHEMVEFEHPIRYFCPVWTDVEPGGMRWWMTFNQHTYSNDLLRILGGENIFQDSMQGKSHKTDIMGDDLVEPEKEKSPRYPRVTAEEIRKARPDIILLPSEPYLFRENDVDTLITDLYDTPAMLSRRIYFVEGELLFWYGTFLAKSLTSLPQFFDL